MRFPHPSHHHPYASGDVDEPQPGPLVGSRRVGLGVLEAEAYTRIVVDYAAQELDLLLRHPDHDAVFSAAACASSAR